MAEERGDRVWITALAAALAMALGVADARAQEDLPILAEVGPWPVVSHLIGFGGRLWFANSVKGRNHNSADIYSYDPKTGDLRYERHLFSQDAGAPLAARGLLYWPFEDSRFSLGWGHFLVTDGRRWRWGTIPTAQIFHTHAMAEAGGRLVAATSAWRAGLQVSADGGASWRAIYDHPTPERRVSRIVSLATLGATLGTTPGATLGARVFGVLRTRDKRRLLRLDGERVQEVPGWPRERPVLGLAAFQGWLWGLVREPEGVSLWRSNGEVSERVAAPRADWPAIDLAADADALWALSAEQDGGRLWRSRDGVAWRPVNRLAGGKPREIALYGGKAYVGGAGKDGRGLLWGPAPPAPVEPAVPAADLPSRPPARGDREAATAALDAALLDPATYEQRSILRDLVYDLVRARPAPGLLAERLNWRLPDETHALIGGNAQATAAQIGRWVLLWGLTMAGEGRVPPRLIAQPWTAPPNATEKYFEAPPAAMWAATVVGQRDRATIAALVARFERPDDPLWLRGDAVGALTALTGQDLAYDFEAWRDWWRRVAASWPE
jgi:hypothetical protein